MELCEYCNGWPVSLNAERLAILAPSRQVADAWADKNWQYLVDTAFNLGRAIEVCWSDQEKGYEFPPYMKKLVSELNSPCAINNSDRSDQREKKPASNLVSVTIQQVADAGKHEDCDSELAAIAYKEKEAAVWVIDQQTQEVLLVNRAALNANNKPPREILMQNISALWEEEVLQALTALVNIDKKVNDHVNKGYRWHKEDGENIWKRVRHEFNVDYQLVNFLGRPARFEIVKNAVRV